MPTLAAKRQSADPQTDHRIDVVCIRKSGSSQDERGQVANVTTMLREREIVVPEQYWFFCTVPRANVQANKDFKRMQELVEADKVRNVYLETQDRFGTDDVCELYTLIGMLRAHDTRLFDLKEDFDLTETDDVTEIKVFVGGIKSKKERQDIGYRSMRTKVAHFQAKRCWPTGPHPFGYAKQCYSENGTLMWEWQPTSRTRGQVWFSTNGRLKAGPKDVPIPRREAKDRSYIKLVPSNDLESIKTVRLIFSLFTKVGLSYRAISKRLNDAGRTYYGKPFTHGLVMAILKNPAYVGDTHFGKLKSAKNWTFNKAGVLEKVAKKPKGKAVRDPEDRLIQTDTHKGLVSRTVWERAQEKVADCQSRKSYSPRNPAYYLHQILVCGHCGKNMCGRPEIDPTTGERRVIYMCSSYTAGRSNGQEVKCGAHRITHADAEQMLLEKIQELKLDFEELRSAAARKNLQAQLEKLGEDCDANTFQHVTLVVEGLEALTQYYERLHKTTAYADGYKPNSPLGRFLDKFLKYYWHGAQEGQLTERLRNTLRKIEAEYSEAAKQELKRVTEEHKQQTFKWAEATAEQARLLKDHCIELESEMVTLREQAKPISERLRENLQANRDAIAQYDHLVGDLPKMACREKGEALRRVFKTVRLYWDKQFIPKAKFPTRPPKTKRPGRNRFTLLKSKTGWEFAGFNLDGPS